MNKRVRDGATLSEQIDSLRPGEVSLDFLQQKPDLHIGVVKAPVCSCTNVVWLDLVLLPDPLQRKRQTYSLYRLHKKSFLAVVDKDPSTRIARCIHLGKAAVGIYRVGPAQGHPSGHLPIDH